MGGYGSGRSFGGAVTEDCRSIDIRCWQRQDRLFPGNAFYWCWSRYGKQVAAIEVFVESGWVRLLYRHKTAGADDWESLDYPVALRETRCHYGGVRRWFACPAAGCGRRVAVLYGSGKYFVCRHCCGLVYKSQRESAGDRAERAANKLRGRLGWPLGLGFACGGKPKGMHWKTFDRLVAQYEVLAGEAWQGFADKVDRIERSVRRTWRI